MLVTITAVVAAVLGGWAEPAAAPAPRLVGRAVLPAQKTWPAPWPAVRDGRPAPASGAVQPVGGFSALVRAGDAFWAVPDNGFGSKADSASFILRAYRVRPAFRSRRGGNGSVAVRGAVQLRDPRDRVPWPIVTEGSRKRLLTGGDFDVESMRIGPRGDRWFGDEFGPFILHTDADGRLLEPPIGLPGVASPDHPQPTPGSTPNLARSAGLEGMALSPDGRRLYPVLEGPLLGDPDPLRRWIYAYDLRRERFLRRRWQYRVEQEGNLVSDFTALGDDRFVVLERDGGEGPVPAFKRVFVVDLDRTDADGSLRKRQVLDLYDIPDPFRLSLPGRPGDFGLGNPFRMPYLTTEAVLPLKGDRLAIVNDNNLGSTRGRNPDRPDPSDFIVVAIPGLRR